MCNQNAQKTSYKRGVRLLNEEDLLDALRKRSVEARLSGAALARALSLGRSQGANLIAGRSRTTLDKLYLWAGLLKLSVSYVLVSEDKAAIVEELLLRCEGMERNRIALVAQFAYVIMHSDESALKPWKYQLAGHIQALQDRVQSRRAQ